MSTSGDGYRVGVLGATGLVGGELLRLLAERRFPVAELVPLASARSAGRRLAFGDREVTVREVSDAAFEGLDLVLASAGASVSLRWLPRAAEGGVVSVDNSSAFREDPDVPLVVPEVNPESLAGVGRRRLVANPNCATIQLVLALKPLADAAGLRRVVVATYQSVSGAGQRAVQELHDASGPEVFEHPIGANVLPKIGDLLPEGDTGEERKIAFETVKILGLPVAVHATCVRVPVVTGHSEAVWVETERPLSVADARRVLAAAPGVELWDDPAEPARYPTPVHAAGTDPVYVGRVRRDPSVGEGERGLALWVVADNLRKGAALNAVQIAEELVRRGLV